MRLFRRSRDRRAIEDRVAEAARAAQDAEAEAELSRRRHESIRRHVVEPLRRAEQHNQFADIIRASLINGHRDRS